MSVPACIERAAAARPSARPALAALSLAMLLSSLGSSSANVALPAIATALGASFHAAQWVVLGYLVTVTAFVAGAGRVGDFVGRRRLLVSGLIAFTLASSLCAYAPGLGVLVAARIGQGIGAAIMMALTTALAVDIVPREHVGRALGLLGSMSAIGTALGPSIGGALVAAAGWRAVFLANLPLGALALLLAWRALPRDPDRNATSATAFDVAGSALLTVVLVAYALAATNALRGTPANLLAGVLAVVGAGAFVRVEARAKSPLVRLALLREPGLGGALAANALVSTVMMATLVVGPFHLAYAFGLGPVAIGAAMAVGPFVAALAGVPAGRLVDRVGATRAARAGLAAIGLGCATVAAMAPWSGLAAYVASIGLATAGYAVFQAANGAAVMRAAGSDGRGVLAGLLGLSRNLGLVTGASAMGTVFATVTGEVHHAAPYMIATGTRATFALATGLVAIAYALTVRARSASSAQLPA